MEKKASQVRSTESQVDLLKDKLQATQKDLDDSQAAHEALLAAKNQEAEMQAERCAAVQRQLDSALAQNAKEADSLKELLEQQKSQNEQLQLEKCLQQT